jgi:RimJ/RimL family protein N-acetyltransferase
VNAAWINTIVNNVQNLAEIAPGVQIYDLSPVLFHPDNVVVEHPERLGAAVFVRESSGVYSGHFVYSPVLRGKLAKEFSIAALGEVFDKHGAQLVKGYVGASNLKARRMARAIGCQPVGHSTLPSGRFCIVYELRRAEWARLLAVS